MGRPAGVINGLVQARRAEGIRAGEATHLRAAAANQMRGPAARTGSGISNFLSLSRKPWASFLAIAS